MPLYSFLNFKSIKIFLECNRSHELHRLHEPRELCILRRMFLSEMETEKQDTVINWFKQNKTLILSDIIKGRGQFSAEWVLVAQKAETNSRWVLKNINEVLQHYAVGEVKVSPRGSLTLGSVLIQRKGGDGGRDTAKMLQFKLDPTSLFNI